MRSTKIKEKEIGNAMDKENRGGKREGAGRKPSGKRKRNYYITDQEHEEIKKLIEQIREGNQYGREHGI